MNWSPDEAQRFLASLTLGTWEGALFATMMATGCRIGEAMALRWDDWDPAASTVSIERRRGRDSGDSGSKGR
ncbi:MAG: tyrosine-type recombinase/integrase [Dehalococcoidia bacterium]|nr:tyrosine-type recombinase/integrase [Dehalococcoidia bacterium]